MYLHLTFACLFASLSLANSACPRPDIAHATVDVGEDTVTITCDPGFLPSQPVTIPCENGSLTSTVTPCSCQFLYLSCLDGPEATLNDRYAVQPGTHNDRPVYKSTRDVFVQWSSSLSSWLWSRTLGGDDFLVALGEDLAMPTDVQGNYMVSIATETGIDTSSTVRIDCGERSTLLKTTDVFLGPVCSTVTIQAPNSALSGEYVLSPGLFNGQPVYQRDQKTTLYFDDDQGVWAVGPSVNDLSSAIAFTFSSLPEESSGTWLVVVNGQSQPEPQITAQCDSGMPQPFECFDRSE